MQAGFLYALGAYAIWGLFPIYFKWLQAVPPLQVISHRVIWSFAILIGIIAGTRQWSQLKAALSLRAAKPYFLASVVLSVNWLIYIWAVNAGFIVETSLGYFINPLVSMLLGRIFLGERLRPLQLVPVVLGSTGALYVKRAYGSLPWMSHSLAGTFGCYGLIKKMATRGSLHGMTMETGFVLLPALVYLAFTEWNGTAMFFHTGAVTTALMVGAGLVTIVPLLMFASAASRISLTMNGMLQYIAPTLQFLIGVFVYHEPFSRDLLIGFSLVWIALAFFTAEGLYTHRKRYKVTG